MKQRPADGSEKGYTDSLKAGSVEVRSPALLRMERN